MHTRKASCASLVLLIFVRCLGVKVMSMDTLKQGDQLNSSSRLVSQNGAFAFGFHTLVYTNNTYLAIWSTHQPSSPVWMANREHPFPNNSSPVLTLATGGELFITLHEGYEPPFVVHGGVSRQNVTATLMNTGNFVVNSTNGELLWQSFDHPTDTLLPGMKLGLKLSLSSWLEQSNPVSGAFTLEWDLVSQTLLIRRRGIVYWMSERLEEDLKSKRGNKLKNFYEKNFNYSAGDEYVTFTPHVLPWLPHNRKYVVWWTLQYEGILVDNSYGNVIAMADECYGYNTNWGTDEGCMIRHVPKCRHHRGKFELRLGDFRPINGTSADLSVRDANLSLSSSDCRDFCWKDCDCVGYDKIDGDGCVYWRGRDSKFQQNLDGSNMMIKRYVLVSPSTKGIKKDIQIIILGVVASVVLIILVLSYFILRKVRKGKTEEAQLDQLLTLEGYTEMLENGGGKSNDLKIFSYASIVTATNNFSSHNKLGEGGFGPVYKGRTVEGQDIAVKVLSRQSGQGLLEFKTELILISKLQHVNLVKLQGFCIHGDDKMIIYDYMDNKSLDFFLFSESKREQLDWQKRFNIIEGTAHGLLYLHKYSRLRIIHRDLKPSNILLDQNMTPKISDFGLARIFKQNVSEANTNRRVGTYGYMAPEYAMQGLFSDKSDVYSFGVLVLEIVSGRKINSFHEIEGPLSIVEYAWELWRKDCAVELMDPALKDCCIVDQLQICIQIGLLCVENLAADRPSIEDVVSMLKNETTSLPMPKNPTFITRNSVLQLAEKSFPPEKLSANEATISEMQGR